MAIISAVKNFKMELNEKLLNEAIKLDPKLIETIVKPTRLVNIEKNEDEVCHVVSEQPIEILSSIELGQGDSICLDFGDHQVGYVSFTIKSVGSPQDAPAYLRLKFSEMPSEILDNSDEYDGWISRGWIQEEMIHLDVLPTTVVLPRRYAFRYFEIKAIATSPKYRVVIEDAQCRAVTSADISMIQPLENVSPLLKRMDEVSIRTLQNCMQHVFEDGPKRDRRLWIGDLRLQALANYETFKNYDLVKRCIYLFAGMLQNGGQVGACLFIEPEYLVDDTYIYEYALFFVPILLDYYNETKDLELVKELWPICERQLEIGFSHLGENGVFGDDEECWVFLDWKDGLDKQAGAQGTLIYTLRRAIELAKLLGKEEKVANYTNELNRLVEAAKTHLWDEELGLFISGPDRQISWASQVWLILAEVFDQNHNAKLLDRLFEVNPEIGMVTPYMYHHLIDALIQSDKKEKALECMTNYWGEMLNDGADTFWELYNPQNKKESPYGSSMVNSYCHAWSCTPTYFIRKYFSK